MSDVAVREVPRLETRRLWLRPWSEEDIQDYARIIGDPEVMRYFGAGLRYHLARRLVGWIPPVARAGARRAIRKLNDHWESQGFGEWAVEEKSSGKLIGQIGLVRLDGWSADRADVEVGWLLARNAWGQGLATEAGRASLSFAFETLALERIVSVARRGNERSVRVMQRLGLSLAGRTRWNGGRVVWYAIDRRDWEQRRTGGGT